MGLNNLLIIAIIIFLIFLVWLVLRALLKDIKIIETTWQDYFSAIPNCTPSQLKGPIILNQNRTLIKLFSNMKKYIGLSILSIVLAAVVISGLLVYNSKEYFAEYFEVQRTKLNLRSEASVDSLQMVIVDQQKQLDSVLMNVQFIKDENALLRNKQWESLKTIKNLQGVIKHQNTMVETLQKKTK